MIIIFPASLSDSLIITITIPPQLSIDQYDASSYEDGGGDSEDGSQQDQDAAKPPAEGAAFRPTAGV